MNPDGSNYQVLHSFSGQSGDTGVPLGSLIADGSKLYGTESGNSHGGNIFAVNLDGSNFQSLHSFTDGSNPQAGLIAVGGVLYGTAANGGSAQDGTVFSMNPDGTNFQVLHTFTGALLDGVNPQGALLQVGSLLYGTTKTGGASGDGTIFSMNLDGSNYNVVHSFIPYRTSSRLPV